MNSVSIRAAMIAKQASRAMISVLLLAAFATMSIQAARAAAFTSVIAFGDSLSDTGNLAAVAGVPAPPYVDGRFSNGPVAVERLATRLGAPLASFAFGGATTGFTNNLVPAPLDLTGVRSQVAQFVGALGGGTADANALYLVWAGSNDFLPLLAAPGDPGPILAGAVANLTSVVNTLYAKGARHFLLPLMPDLGLTPRAIALPDPAVAPALSFLSLLFGATLTAAYDDLELALVGADLTVFDTIAAQYAVLADAPGLGITQTSVACYAGLVDAPSATPPCATPEAYMFWDAVHPTARTHQILGDAFFAAIADTADVGAPATLALLAASFAGLGLYRGRRSALQG